MTNTIPDLPSVAEAYDWLVADSIFRECKELMFVDKLLFDDDERLEPILIRLMDKPSDPGQAVIEDAYHTGKHVSCRFHIPHRMFISFVARISKMGYEFGGPNDTIKLVAELSPEDGPCVIEKMNSSPKYHVTGVERRY